MGFEVRVVATLAVSVILGLFVSVQDSYGGYCGDDGTCCISNFDCNPYSCLDTRGICSHVSPSTQIYCNVDSECPTDDWCVPVGNCVGGEYDGALCWAEATGICDYDFTSYELCRTDEDCEEPNDPCDPLVTAGLCPGGTCVAWPTCPDCYIATAAFGTELEDKTSLLRSFRDEYLLNNATGKALVAAYYKCSPPLADYIAERDWLRALVRILLLPVIGLVSLFV